VSTVVVLVGAGLLLPSSARAQEAKHIHTTSGIVDFDTKTIAIPGYSVHIRTTDDISMRLHATQLLSGHAYTFWLTVTDPDGSQYGGRVDGRVVDSSGIVNLKVEVEVGETVGDFHVPAAPPLQAGQLRNPMTSTIGLVIRDHGPASTDPAELYRQLYTAQVDDAAVFNYAVTVHAPKAP
jgi:hypothetical protein